MLRIVDEEGGMVVVPERDRDRVLLDTAIRAAQAAGEVQRAFFGPGLRIREEGSHDLKLEVDLLCERAIIERIRSSFPNHGILSEETGTCPATGDHVWIIDPLDGTVNFFHGLPYFCTSVSCYQSPVKRDKESFRFRGLEGFGEPLVGVVYVPPTDELFVGIHGQGATRNGRTLTAIPLTDLGRAVVGLSFGSSDETMICMGKVLSALLPKTRKVRCFGSTSLDMVQVASGRLSALVQRGVRIWDIAAARIVLEEAGGVVHAVESRPNRWDIMACVPGIREPLAEIVGRRWWDNVS